MLSYQQHIGPCVTQEGMISINEFRDNAINLHHESIEAYFFKTKQFSQKSYDTKIDRIQKKELKELKTAPIDEYKSLQKEMKNPKKGKKRSIG